jgi:hypothetical protein
MEDKNILNRYTTLPILIDMLVNKHLTMLSPSTWEDRNDAFYLERYKTERNLASLLAACFTTKTETFHHWKVFSAGSSGVCITFHKDQLLKQFEAIPKLHCDEVKYKQIREVRQKAPEMKNWPFLKRVPYRDEGEFRIIYEDETERQEFKTIPIDLKSIRRVTLSPWLPAAVADTLVEVIKSLRSGGELEVCRSTLVENEQWKNAIGCSGLKSASN